MYNLPRKLGQGGGGIMGTFEEPKGGPLDIGEEYPEITILGWEEYWVTMENIYPCWWVGV